MLTWTYIIAIQNKTVKIKETPQENSLLKSCKHPVYESTI